MPQLLSAKPTGSDITTGGVRVQVTPRYLPQQSDPEGGKYLFAYSITLTNDTARPVQLRSRRWLIVDADGESHEVEGEGVVGQQPHIAPGRSFEYTSFCPLPTPWGTMEGAYTMIDEDGATFPVRIARFYLVSPHAQD